jgi:cell volume regulation protein A
MRLSKTIIRQKLFISCLGLKGTAAVVVAFRPPLQGIDKANEIFNKAFGVVLFSIFIQGTTIGVRDSWLGLEKTAESG